MGKINVLITFLFITSNVFGQTFYDIALVEDKQGMNDIQNLTVNDINKKLSTYHYGFWTNYTLYVLSYRANDGIDWSDFAGADSDWRKDRDLLLYRRDKINNNWVAASNVVQTDYEFQAGNNKHGYNKFFYISYPDAYGKKGYGKVLQLKNGCVFMLIINNYGESEKNESINYCYCSVVILAPNGNGTYTATRFEPLNKRTKSPELYGAYCKENQNTNKDKIEIDFNDGNDYYGKLNFTIIDASVNYINGELTFSNSDNNGDKNYHSKDFKLIRTN
jgi:hypothetical protein